ncbi:DUF3606 domain-containing protein [Bradyrhizobium sp. 199]|uniref:DUF3606 domain-containing protein n=1 Tax=Bradyrhizobium sp. 199 TaxID=2782664 RepID=UPI001FF70C9C|nr:DUF3606 domain-containing protein [Bradyrhizobium sp. 199]MCK1360932.1 DUF3606 domain-containing protein [Bradyrhizobium sp. 199]
MQRAKRPPIRNKLDLTDRVQVRLVKKRLHLSGAALTAIVGRIGNSIAAINKEAAQQRVRALTPADAPAAAVVASSAATEQAVLEAGTIPPTS